MVRIFVAVLALVCGAPPAAWAVQAENTGAGSAPEPVQVLLLGTFHFKPSTSDIITTDPGNMLSPQRQAELEALADALMVFEPTAVAIENTAAAPDYVVDAYGSFTPELLTTNPSEGYQIGFRLAAKAGLTDVLGVDERSEDGEPSYFPYGALLEHLDRTGRRAEHDAEIASAREALEAEQIRLNGLPIAQALLETNQGLFADADVYYRMLDYDLGEEQPGSVLNGRWFTRNAKIFSKLMDVTEPGDQVVLIFGAGHVHWLKHLIENTPGYEFVDPAEYLQVTE